MRLTVSAVSAAIKTTIVKAKLALGGAFFALVVEEDQSPRLNLDDAPLALADVADGVWIQAYFASGYVTPLSTDYAQNTATF